MRWNFHQKHVYSTQIKWNILFLAIWLVSILLSSCVYLCPVQERSPNVSYLWRLLTRPQSTRNLPQYQPAPTLRHGTGKERRLIPVFWAIEQPPDPLPIPVFCALVFLEEQVSNSVNVCICVFWSRLYSCAFRDVLGVRRLGETSSASRMHDISIIVIIE